MFLGIRDYEVQFGVMRLEDSHGSVSKAKVEFNANICKVAMPFFFRHFTFQFGAKAFSVLCYPVLESNIFSPITLVLYFLVQINLSYLVTFLF